MPLPTLEAFAYLTRLSYRGDACDVDTRPWTALSAEERAVHLGRMRWVLDNASASAGGPPDAAGVIYAASPTDPPPTSPAP